MQIRASTRVAAIVDAHPEIEELLKWYDVELDDEELIMSVAELCGAYALDLEDLLVEIHATMDDDDDDDDDDDPMDSFWREIEEDRFDEAQHGAFDIHEPPANAPAPGSRRRSG